MFKLNEFLEEEENKLSKCFSEDKTFSLVVSLVRHVVSLQQNVL